MIFPTIHLNGTTLRHLTMVHEKAFDAIQTALDALAECRPNGRDYYPQGPGALEKATEEAAAREEKLQAVMDELQDVLMYFDAENQKREANS